MSTTSYKRGDRLPEYTATLMQGNNTPINLTGTTVRFHMLDDSDGSLALDQPATVVSAADGTVSYAWASGDLGTVGTYQIEWEITFSGARTLTVPAAGFDIITVGDDIA